MIGQKNNIKRLVQWRVKKSIPRFIIIEGEVGSGRLTYAKKIINLLNANGVIIGNGKDDVKTAIENAYTVQSATVYIFRDCDDMSVNAKNSLLKVVEEPPNKAYFIMTVSSVDNVLETIKSRGTVVRIEPYSRQELEQFTKDEKILEYATTPAQCKEMDINALTKAEQLVEDALVALQNKSGTRLLKACTELSAKKDDGKMDCDLFVKVFNRRLLCNLNQLNVNYNKACKVLSIMSDYSKQLSIKSINKKSAVECMLLKILEEL